MTTNQDDPIAIAHLHKEFRGHAAVDDISFTVPRGRVVGLLGPNGAGKTTTMRMLLGLAGITRGTATVLGRPYGDLTSPARSVGAVLDAGGLHPGRTGRQHLLIAAAAVDAPRSKADELLDEVGLASGAHRKIGTWSLGMRQRLALATALLGDPRVLVLDEPANGLDPVGTRWLRDRLASFALAGGSVLLSSHLLAEVAQVADDVVVIVDGRIAGGGSVAALTDASEGGLESFYLDLVSGGVDDNTKAVR